MNRLVWAGRKTFPAFKKRLILSGHSLSKLKPKVAEAKEIK